MQASLRFVSNHESAPSPRRLTLVVQAALLASALLAGACGGAAEPQPAHPDPAAANAERAAANREIVQAKLAEARAALEEDAPRKARFAAEEARRAAGQAELKDVLAVIDEIDGQEARTIATEVRQLAAGRQCQDALDTIAAILKRTPPPGRVLVHTLHDETEAALVACLRVDLDEAIAQSDFARGRSLLEGQSVRVGLREGAWSALAATLHAGIAASMADQVRADILAGKYDDAARKLDAAKQAGKLGARRGEGDGVLAQFQALMAAPLFAKIEGVLAQGKGDPQAVLAEVDAITKLLEWELPENLATAREALAIWAECKKLRCTLGKTETRWTYGSTSLSQPDASQVASGETVPNARKLFVVARAGAVSLVSLEELPSSTPLKERLLRSAGWASTQQLKAEDTIDWLRPASELVGQQVFGPLRESDKSYYLGAVTSVEGDRAQVKRYSDNSTVMVARSSLRSGRIRSGIKVLAYCANPLKMEPAVVEEEVPQPSGLPLVRIACPGEAKGVAGPKRNEVPGAIVSKVEWLPSRKP